MPGHSWGSPGDKEQRARPPTRPPGVMVQAWGARQLTRKLCSRHRHRHLHEIPGERKLILWQEASRGGPGGGGAVLSREKAWELSGGLGMERSLS